MSIKTFVKTLSDEQVAFGKIATLAEFTINHITELAQGKEVYVGSHAMPQNVLGNIIVVNEDVFDLIHDWVVSRDGFKVRLEGLGMYITLK